MIPFRRTATGLEFAVFRRSDAGWWQFVAGGGEDQETPLEAAEREMREETGIPVEGQLLELDFLSKVPASEFAAARVWGPAVREVPEHWFAADVGTQQVTLSREHTEVRWVPHDEACRLLKWDSGRTALSELLNRASGSSGRRWPATDLRP